MTDLEKVQLTDKQSKARKSRSFVLAIVLAAFVIVIYAVTWFKIGSNIMNREF